MISNLMYNILFGFLRRSIIRILGVVLLGMVALPTAWAGPKEDHGARIARLREIEEDVLFLQEFRFWTATRTVMPNEDYPHLYRQARIQFTDGTLSPLLALLKHPKASRFKQQFGAIFTTMNEELLRLWNHASTSAQPNLARITEDLQRLQTVIVPALDEAYALTLSERDKVITELASELNTGMTQVQFAETMREQFLTLNDDLTRRITAVEEQVKQRQSELAKLIKEEEEARARVAALRTLIAGCAADAVEVQMSTAAEIATAKEKAAQAKADAATSIAEAEKQFADKTVLLGNERNRLKEDNAKLKAEKESLADTCALLTLDVAEATATLATTKAALRDWAEQSAAAEQAELVRARAVYNRVTRPVVKFEFLDSDRIFPQADQKKLRLILTHYFQEMLKLPEVRVIPTLEVTALSVRPYHLSAKQKETTPPEYGDSRYLIKLVVQLASVEGATSRILRDVIIRIPGELEFAPTGWITNPNILKEAVLQIREEMKKIQREESTLVEPKIDGGRARASTHPALQSPVEAPEPARVSKPSQWLAQAQAATEDTARRLPTHPEQMRVSAVGTAPRIAPVPAEAPAASAPPATSDDPANLYAYPIPPYSVPYPVPPTGPPVRQQTEGPAREPAT